MNAMTQTTQELKRQLDEAVQLVSRTVEKIGQNPESLMTPTGHDEAGRAATTLPGEARELFESLVARDQQMIQELMRLQRSLSRQSFRGAESARRLVRRLARRAQQSINEVQSLMGVTEATAREDLGRSLSSTLDRIRRDLKRLKTMESATGQTPRPTTPFPGPTNPPQGTPPLP